MKRPSVRPYKMDGKKNWRVTHWGPDGETVRKVRALGYTGNAGLFAHYAELATRAEGEAYFGVFPSAPQ